MTPEKFDKAVLMAMRPLTKDMQGKCKTHSFAEVGGSYVRAFCFLDKGEDQHTIHIVATRNELNSQDASSLAEHRVADAMKMLRRHVELDQLVEWP